MAANNGTLHVAVEVKTSPDKFWNSIRDSTLIFPKFFPDQYKSIEVLHGDGKAVGSVRLITYADGSPLVKVSKERIDVAHEAERKLSYSVIEGDLLKYYKVFKGHITVLPKGDGSLVEWNCEFEKAADDVDAPHIIKDFAVKNFQEVDDLIQANKI